MSGALQVRGLTVAFDGAAVVQGLDLDLAPGEVLGLVGFSGSGKSQALRAIIGLSPPDAAVSGSVRLDGTELIGGGESAFQAVRGRRLGMVFQEPATALDPIMPIGEQVAEGLRQAGRSRADARREAAAWLARVGLDPRVVPPSRRAHQLSGGQRQRVAIAAAAAPGPAILLADEPTTALDPVTQASVMGVLTRLARAGGMGLLLVSHDLALVASLADRIVVLDRGRAVAAGHAPNVLAGDLAQVRALAAGSDVQQRPAPPSTRTAYAPILSARGLTRLYPARGHKRGAAEAGLHPVDFDLHAGEALAVVGATSAGKSTLLRLALGLEPPHSGEVRLLGERFAPLPAARQRRLRRAIQPVFQDPAGSFDPLWSAERIVAEPLGLLTPPLAPEEIDRRVTAALKKVGLPPEHAGRPARAFSGGQRQRLALARALVVGPQVLVLDEATSALDPATRAEVLALIARLKTEDGLACLLVTHDLAVVRLIADRVAVLEAGRIVEEGPAAEVFTAPRQPATRALLAASPTLNEVVAARWPSPQKA